MSTKTARENFCVPGISVIMETFELMQKHILLFCQQVTPPPPILVTPWIKYCAPQSVCVCILGPLEVHSHWVSKIFQDTSKEAISSYSLPRLHKWFEK